MRCRLCSGSGLCRHVLAVPATGESAGELRARFCKWMQRLQMRAARDPAHLKRKLDAIEGCLREEGAQQGGEPDGSALPARQALDRILDNRRGAALGADAARRGSVGAFQPWQRRGAAAPMLSDV